MSTLPPSPHDGGDARSPLFTMDDFQQLVSDAFTSKEPRLSLAITPASPPSPRARISVTTDNGTVKSYFDDDIDEIPPRPSKSSSRRSSIRPRSQSFSAFIPQRLVPPSPTALDGARERPSMAKRVFQTLRTRASALGLRPVIESASTSTARPTDAPAHLPIPPPKDRASVSRSRPTSRYSSTPTPPTSDLPKYSFPTQPEQSISAGTFRNSVQSRSGGLRHRLSSVPSEFLRVPSQHDRRTPTPTLSQPSSPTSRRSPSSPASSMPPTSSRPRTPSLPSLSSSPGRLHVHTRLPPLSKTRSFHVLSLPGRKQPRAASVIDPVLPPRLGNPGLGFEFAEGELDSRCPSPFTNPRDPPPVPTSPSSVVSRTTQGDEEELEVPAYVFERRGSATSNFSETSTRSTRTLAERISKVLPSAIRISKIRSRSKLNLSVITNSSTDSTPSSCDTSTTFSSSLYSNSLPPTPNVPSFYGSPRSRRGSANKVENEDIAMDRVLTPDTDPFKKASVEISIERERTPRPLETGEHSPPASRNWIERNLRQQVARKRSMGGSSGHSYTNSGDTITPLTCLAPSPEDLDAMEVNSFVFPSLPPKSPPPTAYLDWSPVSLRSTAALPSLRDPRAHVVPMSHAAGRSKTSWESVRLPPPRPPPTIPLPPSPTSSGGSSPRLRKRKSWSSLRAAMMMSNANATGLNFRERPPSPFPLVKSAFSSVSSFADSAGVGSGRASRMSERHSEDPQAEMPVRNYGGWVRGPRFAGQGSGRSSDPQGSASGPSGDPDESLGTSNGHQSMKPSNKLDSGQRPVHVSAHLLAPQHPTVRSSRSDSALRAHMKAQEGMDRGALPLPRPQPTSNESEEQWEEDTTRSTTFYSARSSVSSDDVSSFFFPPNSEFPLRF